MISAGIGAGAGFRQVTTDAARQSVKKSKCKGAGAGAARAGKSGEIVPGLRFK